MKVKTASQPSQVARAARMPRMETVWPLPAKAGAHGQPRGAVSGSQIRIDVDRLAGHVAGGPEDRRGGVLDQVPQHPDPVAAPLVCLEGVDRESLDMVAG